jgi:hypothetical protein
VDAILASVKIVSVDTDTPQTVRPPSTAAGGREGGRERREGETQREWTQGRRKRREGREGRE